MGERIDARISGDRNDRRGDSVVGSDAVCRNDVGLRRLHGVCLWNVYLFDAIASGASEPTVNSLAIYTMISGTYTPLIYQFADDSVRPWLLAAIWIAAGYGFLNKVALKHRVNSISTVTYLLLGWLPSIPLIGRVPSSVVMGMFIGGTLYTVGVGFLVNDHKVRYMHVMWHLLVIMAALAHYWTIYRYVVLQSLVL
jgi:hypothetical protein